MKMNKRFAVKVLAFFLMGSITAPLYAQLPAHLRDYPLAQRKAAGDVVAPMFNGWTANEDGSVTMLFGFANRNREEIVDIPLGPNNFIEPAQFDGAQPTHFPVYNRRGLPDVGYFVATQERGAFAVTVPADMAGTEVVWTLNHAGNSYSIPGRATSTAYQMSAGERALGSLAPAIRFKKNGPETTTREGIMAARVTASVGNPVTLSAYIQDRGNRGDYPEVKEDFFPLGTEWILHQGPAAPDFDPALVTGRERMEQGMDTGSGRWSQIQTQATFWEPGEYVLRLRVDNFLAIDSKLDTLCCWSNAYVPVTVTP
jgi:hypothetical protein